jgi:hypothetical protein
MRLEPYAICRTGAWQISPKSSYRMLRRKPLSRQFASAAARRSATHALQLQAEDARKIALS